MNLKNKTYYLYRVKFTRDHQKEIFDDGASASEIFSESIISKPSVKLNRGGEWRLANLTEVGTDGGYFVVGRISKSKADKFDFSKELFFEDEDYQGPFARVYFNKKLGIIAIEDKSKVNSKVDATADRVKKLLLSTNAVKNRKVRCEVEEIRDPEGFVRQVLSCDKVLGFSSHFTGPNPIDADQYFQKPLEVYADLMKASQGKIQVQGPNLDKEMVVAAARTSASTANGASARIQKGSVKKTIPLKKIKTSFHSTDHDSTETYNLMMDRYDQVRYAENNNK